LLSLNQSDQIKAASVGVGVFSGILPIWGFQLLAGLFLAVIFRLNKALVIIASNISIPPMIPLIVFLSYKTGSLLLGDKNTEMAFDIHLSIQSIGQHLKQYICGSITLAVIAGFLAALLTFILLKLFKRKTLSAF
jgi:uncharacterized protein (DUF2062 family)